MRPPQADYGIGHSQFSGDPQRSPIATVQTAQAGFAKTAEEYDKNAVKNKNNLFIKSFMNILSA